MTSPIYRRPSKRSLTGFQSLQHGQPLPQPPSLHRDRHKHRRCGETSLHALVSQASCVVIAVAAHPSGNPILAVVADADRPPQRSGVDQDRNDGRARVLVLTWRGVSLRSPRVFLGFLRLASVEGALGPTIQIFDDDVVAFTRLINLLLLLISTAFPYLCDSRLGGAEAYHADGSCHTNECNSDAAQSLLPDVHGLSVR
jgi:hypothetical protein